jgi:hypothetical protein
MNATFLRHFAVFLMLMVAIPVFSQKKNLRGLITDSTTDQQISMAGIRNIYSGVTVLSHRDGSFNIDVSAGTIIAITANGYFTDTLRISDSLYTAGTILIRLKPLPSTLEDVTVTGSYNRYQLDSIARRRQFLQTVGEHEIPAISRPSSDKDFGIAISLDRYGKTEKNKRKARSLFDLTEEDAYINFRWNESLVNKYTRFNNEELFAFMQKARPTYEWLRKHESEEDLLYYINSQLKKYKKG